MYIYIYYITGVTMKTLIALYVFFKFYIHAYTEYIILSSNFDISDVNNFFIYMTRIIKINQTSFQN